MHVFQAMSEKAAMSREIPHLRGLLASKSKRIGQLEHLVGETKDVANSEYEKLRAENEQIKMNFMAKLKDRERESESQGRGWGLIEPPAFTLTKRKGWQPKYVYVYFLYRNVAYSFGNAPFLGAAQW